MPDTFESDCILALLTIVAVLWAARIGNLILLALQ
jgi:hypothetical protein